MGTLSTISTAAPATSAEAVSRLCARLAVPGGPRLYPGALGPVAVVSVDSGLTVWCWGGLFRWSGAGGTRVTHSAADPEGAARRLGAERHSHEERHSTAA
ncbi:hypothetical protein [Streptomonospora wellingtoniae]|uniref:Uncharacterized protein n=1 Tax=Streptomonospora wellingtoniae TaxID=3075544 RepID=A0ABU2KZX3_9ACTN|nr:hypothetical protein [Streptomonospora sp. DSM 45055]MDT0304855.1 hypothetical protein [Streptomonospora sp. DSM 45055]